MMIKVISSLILIIILLVFVYSPVLAQDSTPSATLKVGHIANVVERLKEKITLFFKFSSNDKLDYYKYLTDKRLAEIAYTIENKDVDRVEETASRYSTTLGKLNEFVLSNKLLTQKEEIINIMKHHEKVIGSLQSNFKFDSGWWLALQHDLNTIKIFSDKLDNLR